MTLAFVALILAVAALSFYAGAGVGHYQALNRSQSRATAAQYRRSVGSRK